MYILSIFIGSCLLCDHYGHILCDQSTNADYVNNYAHQIVDHTIGDQNTFKP
jgi:hypothetical protein